MPLHVYLFSNRCMSNAFNFRYKLMLVFEEFETISICRPLLICAEIKIATTQRTGTRLMRSERAFASRQPQTWRKSLRRGSVRTVISDTWGDPGRLSVKLLSELLEEALLLTPTRRQRAKSKRVHVTYGQQLRNNLHFSEHPIAMTTKRIHSHCRRN